jgi:site-specific recombinase XerD
VPIHAELERALQAWRSRCPETQERLVLPVRGKSGKLRMGRRDDDNGLPELMKVCGCYVPAKPWHALRHTFAAHSVMSGMPLYTLQKLMGHSPPEMTQIYAHFAPAYMAGEMARLSFAAPGEAKVLPMWGRAVSPL